MRAILMFHNCEGQSHKTVSADHKFWSERGTEADSNRGPSAYQPNALPLGQTGSLTSADILNSDERNRLCPEAEVMCGVCVLPGEFVGENALHNSPCWQLILEDLP